MCESSDLKDTLRVPGRTKTHKTRECTVRKAGTRLAKVELLFLIHRPASPRNERHPASHPKNIKSEFTKTAIVAHVPFRQIRNCRSTWHKTRRQSPAARRHQTPPSLEYRRATAPNTYYQYCNSISCEFRYQEQNHRPTSAKVEMEGIQPCHISNM